MAPRLWDPAQQDGGPGRSSFLVYKSRYKPCPAYQTQECSRHCALAHPTPIPKPPPLSSSTTEAGKAKRPISRTPLQLGVVT